jgi:hypothetical protein
VRRGGKGDQKEKETLKSKKRSDKKKKKSEKKAAKGDKKMKKSEKTLKTGGDKQKTDETSSLRVDPAGRGADTGGVVVAGLSVVAVSATAVSPRSPSSSSSTSGFGGGRSVASPFAAHLQRTEAAASVLHLGYLTRHRSGFSRGASRLFFVLVANVNTDGAGGGILGGVELREYSTHLSPPALPQRVMPLLLADDGGGGSIGGVDSVGDIGGGGGRRSYRVADARKKFTMEVSAVNRRGGAKTVILAAASAAELHTWIAACDAACDAAENAALPFD